LLAIVLFIAVFIFSLWFTGFIAKAFNAERPGMLWVFFVFVSITVVQVLAGLTPLVQHPIILLLLLIVVATFIYSKILAVNLLGGFLTMLVSSIVTGIVAVGVAMVVGFSMFDIQDMMSATDFEGEVTQETVALAAEAVCRCETDQQCLNDKSREFGQMSAHYSMNNPSADQNIMQKYTERALFCTFKPGPYDSAKAVIKSKPKFQATPVIETGENAYATIDVSKTEQSIEAEENSGQLAEVTTVTSKAESVKPSQPSYKTVSPRDARKHIGKPARVLRKSGDKMEGTITSVKAGKLMFEQRRYRGSFSFPVKFSDIKKLEVYL